MVSMLVHITIAPGVDREAAKKCQVGGTVTLRASLVSNFAPTSFAVPMAGGTFEK